MSTRQIFISLPVADVQRSRTFYEQLGYTCDAAFSNDNAALIEISDAIRVMLSPASFVQTLTTKSLCDIERSTSALHALSCDSRAHVDELVAKAIAAGGSTPDQAQDHGFMYDHSFEDPDGHGWGVFYMVPNAAQA